MANITGDNKANILKDTSTDPSSFVYGLAGNDTLYGLANDDNLYGDGGNDKLFGGAGNDWLAGGLGADSMNGGDGVDGADYDSSTGVTVALDNSLTATGEAVGDTFVSIEKLSGSKTGADILSGNAVDNHIWGNGGNDKLYGRDGNDWLYGGAGADRIDGGKGTDGASYYYQTTGVTAALDNSLAAKSEAVGDTFFSIENLEGSNTGSDILSGNASANYIWGHGGNDTIYARAGNDVLNGNAGADKIYAGTGDDFLRGGRGADLLNGGDGGDAATYREAPGSVTIALDRSLAARGEAVGDTLVSIENLGGSKFADVLSGNAKSNILSGQGGNDKIYGRAGNDKFYFTDPNEGTDTIMDFASGDRITLETEFFGNLAVGTLHSQWFVTSTNNLALDANDRFIFNQTDHSLWYDPDGTGSAAATKLAILQNNHNLTYAQIAIVDLF